MLNEFDCRSPEQRQVTARLTLLYKIFNCQVAVNLAEKVRPVKPEKKNESKKQNRQPYAYAFRALALFKKTLILPKTMTHWSALPPDVTTHCKLQASKASPLSVPLGESQKESKNPVGRVL